jgi:hypothetical protein
LTRGLLFTRLAGGRTDDSAGVELDGDTEVGARIVKASELCDLTRDEWSLTCR